MTMLTPEGQSIVSDVAARHGFSPDCVTHVLIALDQGGRTQAQFNHWELGGMGQWSMGGMTMIGDMFNNGLKARVDGLCSDLANMLSGTQVFQPPAYQNQSQSGSYQGQSQGGGFGQSSLFVQGSGQGNWWPQDLGQPGSTGAQNDMKYAYFPSACRLAILVNGQVTVYDTGQHQIGGFGQQQGGDQSLTFTSQFGLVRVADLPVMNSDGSAPATQSEPSFQAPQSEYVSEPQATPVSPEMAPEMPRPAPAGDDSDAIFAKIEKLGDLRDKGILSDAEFSEKKMELLSRL